MDSSVPGSGSHYLSVLPRVVCPALLPPEGGKQAVLLYSFSKHRHKFSFMWWCFLLLLFCLYFSLRSLSYWSLAPGAVRKAWWRTLIGCDLCLDYCRGPSLITLSLTSLSVTVITSGLSCLFYFVALRSTKMFFTLTAKSECCLICPFYVFKKKIHIKLNVNSFSFYVLLIFRL